MPEEPIELQPKDAEKDIALNKKKKFYLFLLTSFVTMAAVVLIGVAYCLHLNKPPVNFPANVPITIETGTDVREITEILQDNGVIKSDKLLYYILVLMHEPTSLKASTYIFELPITTYEIAAKLTEGDFDTDLIRLTHFEGERVTQVAARAAEILSEFNAKRFVEEAEPLEGKLFPETYFVPASYTDEDLLKLLLSTFEAEMTKRETQIEAHSLTQDEILVLASIIEREANTEESKRLVASVLQNRLEINMALQADASIEYVLDKPLSELTPEDLKIDSPYNTYLYPGLPPTPIGNPGAEAIDAVLNPAESEYFYYITDNDGVFHYSETYRGHLINIEKYLR